MKKMKLDINIKELTREASKNKRLFSKYVIKTMKLQTKHAK
jgi:hypothetical protein